jgi:acyl carrier protein
MISIFDEVRQTVSDILNVPVQRISIESSTETLEGWDSMQHLSLMMALEEKFRLEFEPEEIERMTSLGRIVEVLERRGVGKG